MTIVPVKDIIDARVKAALEQVRKEPPNPCANLREEPSVAPQVQLPASAPKPILPAKPGTQSYT
jgi:hypothetical protein